MIEETIPAALAGERLDRVVALLLECSRADAAAVIAQGGARLDGDISVAGKVRLAEGQQLLVDPTMLPVAALPSADAAVRVPVVHADDDIIVVDKPAGLVVHPGAGNPDGTLVNGLLALFPEISEVGDPARPGIVHRLDAGTSGLLVVARSAAAYGHLVQALSRHQVDRRYYSLVWGHPANSSGVVDAPLGRDHRDATKMAVVVDGKPARTHFRVLRAFRTPADVAEVHCRLETGRTHQIRVHMAAIGHPVVGDGRYGGVRDALSVGRPCLHAVALAFDHPITGARMSFESVVPDDLRSVVEQLTDVVEPH